LCLSFDLAQSGAGTHPVVELNRSFPFPMTGGAAGTHSAYLPASLSSLSFTSAQSNTSRRASSHARTMVHVLGTHSNDASWFFNSHRRWDKISHHRCYQCEADSQRAGRDHSPDSVRVLRDSCELRER
jgi:hypothetical protein